MRQAEVKDAVSSLIHEWATATDQPMPPDGKFHYSFGDFWRWLESNHRQYTQFRPRYESARDVMENWFDREMRQAWRN